MNEIKYFERLEEAIKFLDDNYTKLFHKHEWIDSIGIKQESNGRRFFIEASIDTIHYRHVLEGYSGGIHNKIKSLIDDELSLYIKNDDGIKISEELLLPHTEVYENHENIEAFDNELSFVEETSVLRPGTKINEGGTISAIVEFEGLACILTNKHVLKKSRSDLYVYLFAQSYQNSLANEMIVAEVLPDNYPELDAGLAKIVGGVRYNKNIINTNIKPSNMAEPTLSQIVSLHFHRGIKRDGKIERIHVYHRKSGANKFFEIQPLNNKPLTAIGSSGTLITDKNDPSICLGIHTKKAIRRKNANDISSGSLSIPIKEIANKIPFKL